MSLLIKYHFTYDISSGRIIVPYKEVIIMLWIDLIDILYLLIGVVLGYIICSLVNRDLMDDECESCEYREFIEEVLKDGE